MMNLLRAETDRLLSRRMTRFFPLGLAALMVVGIVIAIFVADDDGPDFVNDIAAGQGVEGSTLILGPMGFLIPIMAFVIGASFFGADQKTGVIEQLLTWEPRRARFLLARLIGGMAAVFVITIALSTFLVAGLYVLSSVAGSTEGAADIWTSIAGAIIRSGLIGAAFFAFGLAITVITNNSVGSIVGFLIYAFVVDAFILQAWLPKVRQWLPMENADAFVARNSVGDGGFFNGGGFGSQYHHGWLAAGLLVAVWTAAVSAIAIGIFSRRDIA